MTAFRRHLALLLTLLCAPLLVGVTAAPAHAASYSAPLSTAIDDLTTASEVRTGYDRDLFQHWVDADGDGCTTRNEVLIAEADDAPTVRGRLHAQRRAVVLLLRPGLVDRRRRRRHRPHGAARRGLGLRGPAPGARPTRQAYANDLGDYRSLVGVTDNVNQSKGDQDVAEWLPQYDAVPLPARVRRGEAPLAAHRRQRREGRDEEPRRDLHELHDHGDPGALGALPTRFPCTAVVPAAVVHRPAPGVRRPGVPAPSVVVVAGPAGHDDRSESHVPSAAPDRPARLLPGRGGDHAERPAGHRRRAPVDAAAGHDRPGGRHRRRRGSRSTSTTARRCSRPPTARPGRSVPSCGARPRARAAGPRSARGTATSPTSSRRCAWPGSPSAHLTVRPDARVRARAGSGTIGRMEAQPLDRAWTRGRTSVSTRVDAAALEVVAGRAVCGRGRRRLAAGGRPARSPDPVLRADRGGGQPRHVLRPAAAQGVRGGGRGRGRSPRR